jgi:hypothetical protein
MLNARALSDLALLSVDVPLEQRAQTSREGPAAPAPPRRAPASREKISYTLSR